MNNKQAYTTRITNDNYVRPTKTKQDMYTPDEINDMLLDYDPIDDINEVALGTHLRYFVTVVEEKKKIKKFRRGGMLNQNDPKKPFVILSNGKVTWSVQKKQATFWKKRTFDEIKEEYINEIDKLKSDLSVANKTIHKYTIIIKQLKEEVERLHKHIKKLSKKSSKK